MKTRLSLLLLSTVITAGLTTAGCRHGEETECSKYVSLLKGENPSAVFSSIAKNKCQEALPLLVELFNPSEGKYNKGIIKTVTEMWSPDPGKFKAEAEKFREMRKHYVALLRKALKAPETTILAASNIADWGLTEMADDLKTLLRQDVTSGQPRYVNAYEAILRALESLYVSGKDVGKKDSEQTDEIYTQLKDLEDVYVKLLNNSPEVQGIEVNDFAARALGGMRSKKPGAIKGLIKGLFMKSKTGQTLFRSSLYALLKIGPPAVPYLTDVITKKTGDKEIAYLAQFAVKNGVLPWRWRDGMRIPMLLAQIRDPRAAEALLKDIAKPVIEPATLPDALKEDWQIEQTNRIKFDSIGLRSVLQPDMIDKAVEIMRDTNVEIQARLDLATALAFHVSPEATKGLYKVIYEPEATKEEVEEAREGKKKMGPATEPDFVIRFMVPLAYATGPDELDLFQTIFEDEFDEVFGEAGEDADIIMEKAAESQITVLLDLADICQRDYDCYFKAFQGMTVQSTDGSKVLDPRKIKASDQVEKEFLAASIRTKAALILSRWKWEANAKKKRNELLDVAIEAYKKTQYNDELYGDFRRALLLLFERQGSYVKNFHHQLQEVIQAEEKKREGSYKIWNQRLEALTYFLQRGGWKALEKRKQPPKQKTDEKSKSQEVKKDEKMEEEEKK